MMRHFPCLAKRRVKISLDKAINDGYEKALKLAADVSERGPEFTDDTTRTVTEYFDHRGKVST